MTSGFFFFLASTDFRLQSTSALFQHFKKDYVCCKQWKQISWDDEKKVKKGFILFIYSWGLRDLMLKKKKKKLPYPFKKKKKEEEEETIKQ